MADHGHGPAQGQGTGHEPPTPRAAYAHDGSDTHAATDTPEEAQSHVHGKVLISPPEGFDAYQAANPDHHNGDTHEEHEHIHIPPPSFWPILLALSITLLFTGFITSGAFVIIGGVLMFGMIIAWGIEGAQDRPDALTTVPVLGARNAEDALTQGAVVLTSDGRAIGRVTRAAESSPLVRAGWIPTRHGYLARKFIDHIEAGVIVLTLTEDEVRERANVRTERAAPGAGNLMLPAPDPNAAMTTATAGAIAARSESEG